MQSTASGLNEIGVGGLSVEVAADNESDHFVEDFGGQKVCVEISINSVDEFTGAALNFKQVKQGMLTEVQQLGRHEVGCCLVERKGRELAREKTSHGLDLAMDPHAENCGYSSMQNRGARFLRPEVPQHSTRVHMRPLLHWTDSGAHFQFQS